MSELTGLLAAVVLSFAPALLYATVVYQLDRFEKEPKRLLGNRAVVSRLRREVAALAPVANS